MFTFHLSVGPWPRFSLKELETLKNVQTRSLPGGAGRR
jgi:hypothetical protein